MPRGRSTSTAPSGDKSLAVNAGYAVIAAVYAVDESPLCQQFTRRGGDREKTALVQVAILQIINE